MTDEEIKTSIQETCESIISEKISLIKLLAKVAGWVAVGVLVLCIGGWSIEGTREIIQTIHNKAYPLEARKEELQQIVAKEVLITAYNGNITLKQTKTGEYMDGGVNFYSTPNQRVEYYVNTNHPLTHDSDKQRKFAMALDGNWLFKGTPMTELKGGFRDLKIPNDENESNEKNIHTLSFSLSNFMDGQDKEDEIFVTCIVFVYGIQ